MFNPLIFQFIRPPFPQPLSKLGCDERFRLQIYLLREDERLEQDKNKNVF